MIAWGSDKSERKKQYLDVVYCLEHHVVVLIVPYSIVRHGIETWQRSDYSISDGVRQASSIIGEGTTVLLELLTSITTSKSARDSGAIEERQCLK